MLRKKEKVEEVRLSHVLFSEKLQKSKMTQEEFAEKVGVSVRHIRRLKKEDINVSIDLAYNISKQFDVPIKDLLVVIKYEED